MHIEVSKRVFTSTIIKNMNKHKGEEGFLKRRVAEYFLIYISDYIYFIYREILPETVDF